MRRYILGQNIIGQSLWLDSKRQALKLELDCEASDKGPGLGSCRLYQESLQAILGKGCGRQSAHIHC